MNQDPIRQKIRKRLDDGTLPREVPLLTKSGWEIMMYSLELNRGVSFPHMGGTNLSPAWSGVVSVNASPMAAARPVRPMRWT